jgi:hypothetical protein
VNLWHFRISATRASVDSVPNVTRPHTHTHTQLQCIFVAGSPLGSVSRQSQLGRRDEDSRCDVTEAADVSGVLVCRCYIVALLDNPYQWRAGVSLLHCSATGQPISVACWCVAVTLSRYWTTHVSGVLVCRCYIVALLDNPYQWRDVILNLKSVFSLTLCFMLLLRFG